MYKIAHIADTHIRNLKYHDEYRIAFRDLYEKLANDMPDCIVHCGDLAHTKTQLSPEYFQLLHPVVAEAIISDMQQEIDRLEELFANV